MPSALNRFSDETVKALQAWGPQVDLQVGRLEEELIAIRRRLHAHPEPSGEERRTSQFIVRRLGERGIPVRLLRDGIGAIADLTIGTPEEGSPLIAIRADIDALRLHDEKKVEYASRNEGVAHACGHDAHTTIALGAALASAALKDAFDQETAPFAARLRFLFQPAEEISEGAQWLVEQGALEGVEAVLGLHVDPERAAGRVGIRYGTLTANCDEIEIVVEGRGGHAARPHHTLDPIAATATLVTNLYQFLPRAIDSRDPAVFTIGQIAGGYASNVIPERVAMMGSLRTTSADARATLLRRIAEICRGVEQGSGTRIDVRFVSPLASVVNDHRVSAALQEASRQVVGPENIDIIDRPSMGGEDFSVYLEHVPGAMLRLGCARPEGIAPFLHSPHFDIDERALVVGTRILLRAAILLTVSGQEASRIPPSE